MSLKLVHRHGSPHWYIRGSIRGIRVEESTGVSDRKTAEEVLTVRSSEILTRSIHGEGISRTFAEAALSYMEAGGERTHLQRLLDHFGVRPVGRIGQGEIELAARRLCPTGSPATINRQVFTPTVAVLNHAALLGWRSKPVVQRPKQPQGRIRWITEAEAERLIGSAARHLRPLVVFLLSTGARVSEALYLDWRDVDLDRSQVVFVETKNGERRGVPLHSRAVATLASLASPEHRKGAVFRRPDGKAYERRDGGGGQVKKAWKTMLERAKISDFTPHDCRHTWATWHYAANRDLRALMELGGWKSAEMVIRYAHVNTSHLASSIDKIWGNSGDQELRPPVNKLNIKHN